MPTHKTIDTLGVVRGTVNTTSTTYISGTGTAGTDNTAMDVLTRTFAGGIMKETGDRIRIRAYYQATGGTPIEGQIKVNGVEVADYSVGSTSLQVVEAWLHWTSDTNANIIEVDNANPGALSAINASGFDWANDQDIVFAQTAVVAQHLVVYFFAIDFFPAGTI